MVPCAVLFDFGAVVLIGLEAEEREPLIRAISTRLTPEPHPPLTEDFLVEVVGRVVEVLSEGPSRKDPRVATTRTRTGKLVHVPGPFQPGAFLDVKVDEARAHHLVGSPV